MSTWHKYQVAHISEECDCQWCGAPLYVGDYVTTDEFECDAYCGTSCATKGAALIARADRARGGAL